MIKAKERCEQWGVDVESRIRRRRRMPGELAQDAGLSTEEEIVRIMKSILDRLQQEMTTRFTRLKDHNFKFGFLLDVDKRLKDDDHGSLRQKCIEFGHFMIRSLKGLSYSMKYVTAQCFWRPARILHQRLLQNFCRLLLIMAKMFSQICELLYKFFLL